MQAYFRRFQQIAEAGNYHALDALPVPESEFFNWTTEILEDLHVANHPEKTALASVDATGRQQITYAELAARANCLLNYWRAATVRPQEAMLLMVPMCAELWDTYVAGIKGGQILIPTASIMTANDLEYRFGRLLPAVVIADLDNAAKIDTAEQALGEPTGLKMLVGGPAVQRPGSRPRPKPSPPHPRQRPAVSILYLGHHGLTQSGDAHALFVPGGPPQHRRLGGAAAR